jgi:hypothetical protein
MTSIEERFLELYEELSGVLQEQVICEAEISIFNLRKLLNTILVNSKSSETKTTLKDMLKVLTKMELGSLPMPNLRKISDKTVNL